MRITVFQYMTTSREDKEKEMKIKKLTNTAKTPTRGTDGAAGYDLYADLDGRITIEPFTVAKIPTNIAMEIPKGYFGAIYARSGMATKKGLRPAQGTAVIDEDYRGNIIVPLFNQTDKPHIIDPGERIAQLVITPYIKGIFNEVTELSDTERGEGGFGSTGTR